MNKFLMGMIGVLCVSGFALAQDQPAEPAAAVEVNAVAPTVVQEVNAVAPSTAPDVNAVKTEVAPEVNAVKTEAAPEVNAVKSEVAPEVNAVKSSDVPEAAVKPADVPETGTAKPAVPKDTTAQPVIAEGVPVHNTTDPISGEDLSGAAQTSTIVYHGKVFKVTAKSQAMFDKDPAMFVEKMESALAALAKKEEGR